MGEDVDRLVEVEERVDRVAHRILEREQPPDGGHGRWIRCMAVLLAWFAMMAAST